MIEVKEEVWVNADGINVFDEILTQKFQVRNLQLQKHTIRYQSYSEIGMTPLDMHYSLDVCQHTSPQQESSDGTGTLVWLASKALAWAFDHDVHGIFSKYIRNKDNQSPLEKTIICELGCGTGLAGLSTLVLAATQNDDCSKGNKNQLIGGDINVIFTDNDNESLDNCRQNCELNGISSDCYCHKRLSWGMSDTYPSNYLEAVDLVLAADVLYETKMIPPLLQTASELLRPNSASRSDGGYLILSHVPRFCLSRDHHEHHEGDDNQSDPDQSFSRTKQPFQLLEQHIIDVALSCGFVLVNMFRPHLELHAIDHDDDDLEPFQHHHSRDSSIRSSQKCQPMSFLDDVLDEELLVHLETANACVFVFQKCALHGVNRFGRMRRNDL